MSLPSQSVNEMAYIGVAPCGCTFMAVIDSNRPERKKTIAKDIAGVIRDGGTVEHVTAEQASERLTFDCPHEPKWGGMP